MEYNRILSQDKCELLPGVYIYMDKKLSNPCTRCGKARIESRSWTEKIEEYFGESTIIHTETVCPDADCQKIVEEKLAAQKQKTMEMQAAREERMRESQRNRKKKQN
ncbi:MAG: hypothetical protein UT56_C0010G0005 [Candidatus Levybacteria bacterium GW2011_GWB1_39_7]|nr:MAG: hypothetical protein UT56_C0010G0005 [Candidatus Levybacteria bacterium GW2011_GWB1_39_7]KKR49540.1 MAG: hypothetical protein UT85_C0016G0017 [Candidatus Levybacteria bacterium GW2011_GWA2_40_16]